MKQKNWIILLVIVVIAILGFLAWQYQKGDFAPIKEDNVRNKSLLTPAKAVLALSEEGEIAGAKFRVYDMIISKEGFSIPRIVVNKGDGIQLNLTAVDGKYDFGIKNFGFYMAVATGTQFTGSFDAIHVGTFEYSCETFCPPGGKITGELVVLE